MKASASTLAIGLLLSVALPAGAALASDPNEQLLLERANYWRAQQRLDLAGQILNKILAVNPGQPDALYQKSLMAIAQGDRGSAEQYLDRLRLSAPADRRTTELAALLGQGGAMVSAVQPVPEPVAASVAGPAPVAPPEPTTTSTAAPEPAAPPVTPTPATRNLLMASADSDDLIPVGPATPSAPRDPAPPRRSPAMLAVVPQIRQEAALPPATISDANTSAAPPPLTAGSADVGIITKAVQVAQIELEPPPPVGGYQVLGTLKPYSPTDTLETYIERDLTRLEAQANPSLIAGLGFRAHSGSNGTSELTEVGAPVQLSFSPLYTGTATIAVLPVYLDAGNEGAVAGFGANAMNAALGSPLVAGRAQNASGVGLLGSYAYTDFSGQFGASPLGFPVVNYVGNVAYTPKFFNDTLSVRFEGLRQPVTDSVLSYAGTRANLTVANLNGIRPGAFGTNTLWGGVVKTGPQISAFYDDQMYGAYAGVGVGWLTGTNVAQNSEINALLGAYFRPWKTDDWAIRLGVSFYYTAYDKNLSGFTFGQGGYFSPQDFEGLGFPVEYTGRSGPWSWLANATLGVQHFNEKPAPVFPLNQNQQIALETLSPSTAFTSSVHGGVGFGFNLKGQIEYALDRTTSIGAAGSVNNGNNYDEGIVQVYLRKTFDWFAPVAIKDDPQSIAARDLPMSRL